MPPSPPRRPPRRWLVSHAPSPDHRFRRKTQRRSSPDPSVPGGAGSSAMHECLSSGNTRIVAHLTGGISRQLVLRRSPPVERDGSWYLPLFFGEERRHFFQELSHLSSTPQVKGGWLLGGVGAVFYLGLLFVAYALSRFPYSTKDESCAPHEFSTGSCMPPRGY